MNYAAVLSVLAAAAFGLPLVVRTLQAFGVARGLSVALVVVGASLLVVAWAVNARHAQGRGRAEEPGRAPGDRPARAVGERGARPGPALGLPPGGAAAGGEGPPLGLREP